MLLSQDEGVKLHSKHLSFICAMSESQPSRRGHTLKAGGGQASAKLDHFTVKEFAPVVTDYLERVYKSLASSNTGQDPNGPPLTSFDQFKAWFQSPASAALAPPVNHDLTFPLCNYYISSSHNTYLSGNQLYGAANTQAYTNVLLRGCRCLEIDVWNGEDEESGASGSDVEGVENEKSSGTHRKRALSRLKNIKGRAVDKLAEHSAAQHKPHHHEHPVPDETDGLAEGVSAVEIAERRAVWKTEPRVYHGYTLTKDISFREVCQAIRDAAFKASTLPVIVSLEVHCNLDQQQMMVDIMQETWKGHLVDMTGKSYDEIQHLPSPDALRNKILIKAKWTPTTDSETNNPVEITNANDSHHADGAPSPSQKKKAARVLDALSKLGVYTRAYSFKHFGQPEAKIPTHVFSIDENKLGSIHSHPDHGPDMFHHNRNFLVRIYPSGLRVNSSNIDPSFSWRQGAQMVALNWQSLDKGTMLNEGMFAGEEGYVLKPEGFRSNGVSNQPHPIRRRLNLTIRLVAGQNLPMPADKDGSYANELKPYVKFELHVDTHGPPGQGKPDRSESSSARSSKYSSILHERKHFSREEKDDEDQQLKRKSRTSRTANPDYGHTELSWTDVPDVVEQLSFLRVKVQDDRRIARDDLCAWACIRLDRLKTGYRFLHLLDVDGEPSEGFLLVHIDKVVH